ncbi:AraC family transcriptional regulator [Neorhizobium vignae]|jgi:AraC-like DNA-binding protein|uniref:AraC family transcriptional regulator n=1 Tax=Neorhizobium vignae TaxID=690585 RepID=UPI000562B1F3|nr:helix-turn-helix transcriptional regulator [Neorhizobium vignae]
MELPFRLSRGFKGRGGGLPMHTHEDAQLTFAASGMVQVHTSDGRWLVPPQLAVWIPAGIAHRVEVLNDAELWMVRVDPGAARTWSPATHLDRTFALRVTPLLRSLLDAAFAKDIRSDKAELMVRLMLYELIETADAPTFLPMPTSEIGKRLAEFAFADLKNQLSIGELASRAATSVRTASRLFPMETGLTFKSWRQRARIIQAMDRLSRGVAIIRTSSDLGFSSTAAFSSAFRQVTGVTPTIFLALPTSPQAPSKNR